MSVHNFHGGHFCHCVVSCHRYYHDIILVILLYEHVVIMVMLPWAHDDIVAILW